MIKPVFEDNLITQIGLDYIKSKDVSIEITVYPWRAHSFDTIFIEGYEYLSSFMLFDGDTDSSVRDRFELVYPAVFSDPKIIASLMLCETMKLGTYVYDTMSKLFSYSDHDEFFINLGRKDKKPSLANGCGLTEFLKIVGEECLPEYLLKWHYDSRPMRLVTMLVNGDCPWIEAKIIKS